jgi:Ala-tRNA(Pro) deacylase
MTASAFERVCTLLRQKSIAFDVLKHPPVHTSEEAAAVRGTPLSSGAKALVCKVDDRFVMIVMPADRKLAGKAVRKSEDVKSVRFASLDEVQQLTGLAPGSIPPFGSLFGLETWCDSRLVENARINFNAGDRSISISMSYADYVAAELPKLGLYAE